MGNQMLTLYGALQSRTFRGYWLLREIGIPFEHVAIEPSVHLKDPLHPSAPVNTQSPEFSDILPARAVPVLRDGEMLLSDSFAINLYLANVYGGGFGPSDELEKQAFARWSFFAAADIEPLSAVLIVNEEPGYDWAAWRRRATTLLDRQFEVLSQHLRDRTYIVGERFTAADIIVAETTRYAKGTPLLMEKHQQIANWLSRCHDRSVFHACSQERELELEQRDLAMFR